MNWYPITGFPGYEISENKREVRLVIHREVIYRTIHAHKGTESVKKSYQTLYSAISIKDRVGIGRPSCLLWSKDLKSNVKFYPHEYKLPSETSTLQDQRDSVAQNKDSLIINDTCFHANRETSTLQHQLDSMPKKVKSLSINDTCFHPKIVISTPDNQSF